MSDIDIRINGQIGHITLNRPKAMNALTYDMCLAIEGALDTWADDDAVKMVLIDANGERAFCAGGDIQEMYDQGVAGNFEYGRKFWRDEYRLNAKIFNFPKPYIALMQGFTMGGGVGVSCHGSHRVVCETSQIAMPEARIGLVPDVGGSLLLARAPGRVGEYLGTTTARMDGHSAIYAGFADYFVPYGNWADLTAELVETGDWTHVDRYAEPVEESVLEGMQPEIDRHFAGVAVGDILKSLALDDCDWARETENSMRKASPLAVACTIEMIHRVRGPDSIEVALGTEYRFTYRAKEHGDFLEGIRAAIIDRDKAPKWKHTCLEDVKDLDVTRMLMPLAVNALKL